MSFETTERISRAGVLARLDRLIDVLSASSPERRGDWNQTERLWLAELLHPFSSPRPEECRLQPSPSVSSDEGIAILGAISEEIAHGRMKLDAAEKLVTSLADLRSKLVQGQELDSSEYSQVLQVARLLRRYLLPDPPFTSSRDSPGLFARW